MKKAMLSILLGLLFINLYSQEVPQVQLKTLNGKTVNTKDILKNDGKPVLVCFFATWCSSCIKELTAFNEDYPDLIDETGVKIIVVAIDNARTSSNVGPFVNSRGWEFDVYLDTNEDFKRAMNVGNIPHTFLYDGKGKMVWQHTSYIEGSEKQTYDVIRKVAKGESIK